MYKYFFVIFFIFLGCGQKQTQFKNTSEILGNPDYPAICYGGYRYSNHDIEPSIDDIKEDLLLLNAIGIKVLRTYKVHYPHAENVIKAIKQLQIEDSNFEMYVMLGAWIDCKNAWTGHKPIHNQESERNTIEIKEAVRIANAYPCLLYTSPSPRDA